MLLTISFLSAIVGVGIAGTAALLPDTGINGTLGAILALFGSAGVAAALGLLLASWVPVKARGVFMWLAGLVAILTALAAWFLMQNILAATMAVTLLTLLASAITANRKISQ